MWVPGILLPLFVVPLTPHGQAPTAPGEVRIRYGIYAPPRPVISGQSNLVELAVTVRARDEKAVGGFKIDDFQVSDNGKPRHITFFSERRAPLQTSASAAKSTASKAPDPARIRSIALFIDDTHIAAWGIEKSKLAADRFIDDSLLPGDQMAVFTDSGIVTLDFTSDKAALHAAIAQLKRHEQRGARGWTDCPRLDPYSAYVVANNLDFEVKKRAVEETIGCTCQLQQPDGVEQATGIAEEIAASVWAQVKPQSAVALDVLAIAVRRLSKMPGTRILTMISPGFVSGDMDKRISTLQADALRARIVINSLNSTGAASRGLRQMILTGFMADSAAATGGRYIESTNDLDAGFRGVVSLPEVSYLLGFSPEEQPDGTYHRLSVKLKNRGGNRVESREGYYATPLSEHSETVLERIDREVASNSRHEEIPTTVRIALGVLKDGRYTIAVAIHVDAKRLKFPRQGDRHVQELTFATVLEDSSGNYITGKLSVMDLSLSDATLTDFQAKGIKAALSFTAPKGSYRIRQIVREAVENHFATSSAPFEIR